jgi:hypothetical protein
MAESDTARYKWGSRKVAYIQRIDSLGKRFAIWARLGQGIPHLLSIGVMLNVVWNMPCTCHCARWSGCKELDRPKFPSWSNGLVSCRLLSIMEHAPSMPLCLVRCLQGIGWAKIFKLGQWPGHALVDYYVLWNIPRTCHCAWWGACKELGGPKFSSWGNVLVMLL